MRASRWPAIRRAFSIVAFGGLLVSIATFALAICANLAWVDFLHDNPHRTHGNALLMMGLSPIYGGLGATVVLLPALLLAGAIAGVAIWLLGKFPLWVALASLLPCALVTEARGNFMFPADGADGPNYSGLHAILLYGSYQVIAAVACWYWVRRRQSSP